MAEGAIGVDVGGTKIAAGLVSADGAVLARRAAPTGAEREGNAVLADAVALAEALAGEARERGITLRGVGVGVPELIGLDGDVLTEAVLRWRGLPVADAFAAIAPARVESDVRAAALAELRLGAGRPFDPVLYVTVGTGISSCLVVGGRPYAGARGAAIVLASGTRSFPCEACGTEASLVVEEAAAGPALVREFAARGGLAAGAADVVAAAAAGDERAAGVVERAGRLVGEALAVAVDLLDPAAVVVGGGLGSAEGPYFDALARSARRSIWYEGARDLPIVRAALGADSGLVGAALAALPQEPLR
jgi:glucokinase